MRIIAGKYRGKNLFSPKDDKIRPTSDRARESIFNVINSKISNSWDSLTMADVFSGTGAIGFEAISRGIKDVCLIDVDVSLINKNLELFKNDADKIYVIKSDISHLPIAKKPYDIVFMDAPYGKNLSDKALRELLSKKFIKSGTFCIIELEKKEDFIFPDNFTIIGEKVYGIAKFILAEYSPIK